MTHAWERGCVMAEPAVIIGKGMLNWHRHERVGDRYGTVVLYREWPDEHKPSIEDYRDVDGAYPDPVGIGKLPTGEKGHLRATVVRNRESGHIGDLFRGLFPPDTPPAPGTVVELGQGELFVERVNGTDYVGLKPDDGRAADWLDPQALYSVHEQTVVLEFVPD